MIRCVFCLNAQLNYHRLLFTLFLHAQLSYLTWFISLYGVCQMRATRYKHSYFINIHVPSQMTLYFTRCIPVRCVLILHIQILHYHRLLFTLFLHAQLSYLTWFISLYGVCQMRATRYKHSYFINIHVPSQMTLYFTRCIPVRCVLILHIQILHNTWKPAYHLQHVCSYFIQNSIIHLMLHYGRELFILLWSVL